MPGARVGTAPLLAAAGAVVVYCVDRLRDVERDRQTRPDRSAFVEEHRRALLALTAAAAAVAAGCVLRAGPRTFVLCAAVAGLGLLHRQLKHIPAFKWTYVTGAWVAVTVGLPAVAGVEAGPPPPSPAAIAWPAAVLAATFAGNLVASDLRPGIGPFSSSTRPRGLKLARGLIALGIGCAVLAPVPARSLLWVPLAELVALFRFRSDERYGLVIVDGALLVGACLAIVIQMSGLAARGL